jgi:Rha family phage regulatory protein
MSKALTIGFQDNAQGFNCITSIQVANEFDLRHDNVLRKVASLIEEEDLDALNSEGISYKDSLKRSRPMYLLTESGFSILIYALNLRTKKQKEKRKRILALFRKKQQVKISSGKESLKGKCGHISVTYEGDKYPTKVRVLKENHTEEELREGKLLHMRGSHKGLGDAIQAFCKEWGLE